MEETGNPVIDAGQFLGDDGAFSENWQEQAFGAEDPMRTDATLKNTKDVRSMCSQLVNAQKQIGQFSSGREFAILPNEQSDQTEIDEYHTKCGRPAAAADYKLSEMQVPEGMAKDDKLAEHMAGILHKAGASSKTATEVYNGYTAFMKTAMDENASQNKLDDAEANRALRTKLGAAYDKTLRDVGVMINAFGNDIDADETAALLAGLPNDSFATQLLGKIAAKFTEGGLDIPADPTSGEMTPADAISKANEIMKDPYYVTERPTGKPLNRQYHDELVQKVQSLMQIATNTGGA